MKSIRQSLVWILAVAPMAWSEDPSVQPLPQAHAHNDYAHDRPLVDALSHGFCSVEADVFAINGQLLVGHSILEVRPERTLEALYLDPLLKRVEANQGRVYPDGPRFYLLIDFKSKADVTYDELKKRLDRYTPMLSRWEDGTWHPGAVTIVISGNRPTETVFTEAKRYVGIDGRPEDLDLDAPAHALPMISQSWGSLFRWRGEGEMPTAERDRLRSIVARAHEKGRVVRFWATPEKESVWQLLADEKVDLINTDALARLQAFLLSRE